MKQVSFSIKAVGFAVALAAANMANAATTDFGTIPAGGSFSTFVSEQRLGVFEDFYTFKLLGASAADVTRTITFTMDETTTNPLSGFNGLTRTLHDAVTNDVITGVVSGIHTLYTLAAGEYYFRVAGEGWVDLSRPNVPAPFYHGQLNIAAVPEPQTYAMLLAGLGLLGTIVKRRSQGF